MTDAQKEALKSRIEGKIRMLEEDIADMEIETQPVEPSNTVGRLSRLDAIQNQEVIEASLRQSRSKLHNMRHRLGLYVSEAFGNCTACGEAIQYERLWIMPEALTCMSCARKP